MADSTLDSELIMLYDRWPGRATRNNEPSGDITAAAHHNVATAIYKAGEKVVLRNEAAGKPGQTIFIYLQVGTQNADAAIAVKTAVINGSATIWYQVANNPDADKVKLPTCLGAYALSAMTNAYWGWFWCGGVCPEEFVSGMGGNYPTADATVAGNFLFHDLAADAIGIGPCSAVNEAPAGFALAADA